MWRNIKLLLWLKGSILFSLLVHVYGPAKRTHEVLTSFWWRQPTLFSSARFVSGVSKWVSTMYIAAILRSAWKSSWLLFPGDLSIVIVPCGNSMWSLRQKNELFPGVPNDKKRFDLYQRDRNFIKCYNLCFNRCEIN